MALVDMKFLQGIAIENASTGVNIRMTTYAGNPEGNVTGTPGSLCSDTTNGKIYKKTTGSGTTGWEEVSASTILQWKQSVRLKTTTELNATAAGSGVGKTLTANVNGKLTLDSVDAVASDRVLVDKQGTGTGSAIDNGIYTVTNAGSNGAYATPSGTITYGTPSNTDTVVFTGLPTDGTKTFTKVAATPGTDEFTSISELTALINGLTDLNATDDGSIITMTVATIGTGMNSATVTGTGTYSGLSITFSGGINTAAWVLTRATDFDQDTEVKAGSAVIVDEGTANHDTIWVLTTNDPITVDTTALNFSSLGIYTASLGVKLNGSNFEADLDAAGGLELNTNSIRINVDATNNSTEINASNELQVKGFAQKSTTLTGGTDTADSVAIATYSTVQWKVSVKNSTTGRYSFIVDALNLGTGTTCDNNVSSILKVGTITNPTIAVSVSGGNMLLQLTGTVGYTVDITRIATI